MTPEKFRALIAHHKKFAEDFGRTAAGMTRVGHHTAAAAALDCAKFHREAAEDLAGLLEAFQLFNHQALSA